MSDRAPPAVSAQISFLFPLLCGIGRWLVVWFREVVWVLDEVRSGVGDLQDVLLLGLVREWSPSYLLTTVCRYVGSSYGRVEIDMCLLRHTLP